MLDLMFDFILNHITFPIARFRNEARRSLRNKDLDYLKVGDKVWVSPSKNRWLVGRISRISEREILLEDSSWIDHTGEYWGESLMKSIDANGWSSEFQGNTLLQRSQVTEIIVLEDSVRLPESSIRPMKDSGYDSDADYAASKKVATKKTAPKKTAPKKAPKKAPKAKKKS